MFEWTRGVSGFMVIAHKCYGRWDWFVQLQWADAWARHCIERSRQWDKQQDKARRALQRARDTGDEKAQEAAKKTYMGLLDKSHQYLKLLRMVHQLPVYRQNYRGGEAEREEVLR